MIGLLTVLSLGSFALASSSIESESPSPSKVCFGTCFNPAYEWDVATCSCVLRGNESCNIRCREGFTLVYINGKCECVPVSSESPSPDVCLPVECVEGLIFDPLLCECVADVEPTCDPGFVYSHEACKCVCANQTQCSSDNWIMDENTCECVCPLGQECDLGYRFDSEITCGCVCDEYFNCTEGFVFDEEKCFCACIANETCPTGYIWDELTCSCIQEHQPHCDPGFVYSHEACKCICKKICTSGFLNLDTCTCEAQ